MGGNNHNVCWHCIANCLKEACSMLVNTRVDLPHEYMKAMQNGEEAISKMEKAEDNEGD